MSIPLPPLNLSAGGGGPSGVGAGMFEGMFDSSGWNVNFGAGTIESSRAQAGPMPEYLPYLLIGGALLVVWRMTRR